MLTTPPGPTARFSSDHLTISVAPIPDALQAAVRACRGGASTLARRQRGYYIVGRSALDLGGEGLLRVCYGASLR